MSETKHFKVTDAGRVEVDTSALVYKDHAQDQYQSELSKVQSRCADLQTKLEASERDFKREYEAVLACHNRIDDDAQTINRQCAELGRLRDNLAESKLDTERLKSLLNQIALAIAYLGVVRNDSTAHFDSCQSLIYSIDTARQSSKQKEQIRSGIPRLI